MNRLIKYIAISVVIAAALAVFKTSSAQAACTALPTTYGSATTTVNIPATGVYTVWSRINAPDSTNNSYYLEVDDTNCGINVGDSAIAANTWTWVDYKSGTTSNKVTMSLTAGAHTIKMIGREPSVKLDRILFLSDTCVPTGTGDNCLSTTPDPEVSVNITGITEGQTVSGTVDPGPGATAVNATSVNSVAFYIDNVLYRTENSSPYCMVGDTGGPCRPFDTTTLTNGAHSIKVVMTYNTSQTVQKTVNFNVNNEVAPPPADVTAPSVPQNLQTSNVGETSVSLGWSASTDNVAVSHYLIYRDSVKVGQVTATSFTNSGLSANTPYLYCVSAVDTAGNESVCSSFLTVTTKASPDTTAPTAPTNVTATANSSTQITVNWGASTDNVGVVRYLVSRNGNVVATVSATATRTYQDTNLLPSTTYTYSVKAEDAAGNAGPGSANVSATTQPTSTVDTTPPSAPTNVTAQAISFAQVNLSWSASSDNVGVAGYRIYRNGSSTPIATTTSTTYADGTVSATTGYTYNVKAFDAAGNESVSSNTASVTTPSSSGKLGDLNNDGVTDIYDLSILLSNWKRQGNTSSDLNGDGVVDIYDLSILLTNYKK